MRMRSAGFCHGRGTGCSLRLESGAEVAAETADGDNDGVGVGVAGNEGLPGGVALGDRVTDGEAAGARDGVGVTNAD